MTDSPAAGLKKDPHDHTAIDKRVRRHVTGRFREYFAITAPGFEEYCRQELLGLGLDKDGMSVGPGGVTFCGRFVDCQRANLYLRTATRVLMRIGSFLATNARRLEKKSGEVPWELFLPAGILPEINVRSRRSRLYHTDVISRALRQGIARRLGGSPGSTCPDRPRPCLCVWWKTGIPSLWTAAGRRFTNGG